MKNMENLKICNADSEEIEKGKWTDFRGGVRLKIAMYNSTEYLHELQAQIRIGKKMKEAITIAMSKHILTGWENFKVLDEGKEVEVEFTQNAAYWVLKNCAITRDFVIDFSKMESNYIEKGLVDITKKP